MRHGMIAVAALLALGACENGGDYSGIDMAAEEDAIVVTGSRVAREGYMAEAPSIGGVADEGERDEADAPQDPQADSFLAYRYNYGLEAPADAVRPLVQSHQTACESAGPRVCQIVTSTINEASADRVSARLMIRAQPDWLAQFRAGLEADAENAGGSITSSSQAVEDLTRPILDTQARLDAQVTLRERLLGLLERQGASVEELIRVERELARVNGDIESATAQLRAMRARVSMSTADLDYRSEVRAISHTTVNPVAEAFRDFAGIVLGGLAVVIRLIAALIPWLILIIPAVVLVTLWRQRVNRRKAAEKSEA
ncbi:MAG: hypothetical protein CMF74_15925 [Maricaulis sp.]|nr:hypothetical protein [Maricaulis sp.]HAQ34342.1 hypothetical protein [Alphaproteobacteria bacterium]